MPTYSYNAESPSQTTMENMYAWLTGRYSASEQEVNSGEWGSEVSAEKLESTTD